MAVGCCGYVTGMLYDDVAKHFRVEKFEGIKRLLSHHDSLQSQASPKYFGLVLSEFFLLKDVRLILQN